MGPSAEQVELSACLPDPHIAAVVAQLAGAWELLRQSYRYAQELECSRWEFAVELPALREAGASTSDLRFLISKRLVEHGLETTMPGDKRRHFRRGNRLQLCRRSCFVLSDGGVRLLPDRTSTNGDRAQGNGTPSGCFLQQNTSNGGGSQPEIDKPLPRWDSSRHELRVGGRLVKQFKQPSPNQETILMAFEEEHWPARIDDPLPPVAEQCPKRRLHDAIKCLNRNHKNRLVRFRGDGTGEGVVWEYAVRVDRADS
jgi:hypothetical protein